MITMRSSTVTKVTKPPPPVPPRPSKTIVAEALAKRRRTPEESNTIPVRSAPPPPIDLSRSQSTVNFALKRPPAYERSISEELKSNSRTLIFQSSNMKNTNNNVLVKDSNERKVTINNSYVNCSERVTNNKVLSETKESVIVTSKNIVNSSDTSKGNQIKITQIKEEIPTSQPPELEHPQSNGVTINSQIITCSPTNKSKPKILSASVENISVSPNGTMENPLDIEDARRRNSFDEKWEGMLKDKNHVNKLIDEMFASVLEASNVEEVPKTPATPSPADSSTTITINGCNNNKYESSSCNLETTGSTVLIIESGDNAKIEKSDVNLTMIGGSVEKIYQSDTSNSSTMEKKSVKFDDKKNAEFLIEELESMRVEQEKILKRQRKPSMNVYDSVKSVECDNEDNMGNNHMNVVDLGKGVTLDYDRLQTMSSLHGLPPLPKSLSGFNLDEHFSDPSTPARSSSNRSHQTNPFSSSHGSYHQKPTNGTSDSSSMGQGRKSTNMDSQLAILKREMYSLRQQDLSLLSQLWSLNESIQDFRQILQDQEDCRVLSPPSPSPDPSSGDEGDCDEQYYVNTASVTPIKFRPAPPPPPLRRSSNSSNASTGG